MIMSPYLPKCMAIYIFKAFWAVMISLSFSVIFIVLLHGVLERVIINSFIRSAVHRELNALEVFLVF